MITLSGIAKRFGPFTALDKASLDIRDGELLALLGPSGSGKTTLLRIIAGLDMPDEGRVAFSGEDVTRIAAHDRGVGFVFQHYALFSHMTVARNIAFGLEVRAGTDRPPRAEINARVEALLDLVGLGGFAGRFPKALSGGERQRVALARALAVDPKILLLDEPFGALDATVRKSLRKALRRIHEATGVTTLFVTHDQEEALDLADRVAILNGGRIEQVGTPEAVQDAPATAFVAGFVGDALRFDGEVRGGVFRAGEIETPASEVGDGPAAAFVRPHEVELAPAGGIVARIDRVVALGPLARIEARLGDGRRIEAVVSRADADGLTGEVRLVVRRARVFSAAK